MHAIAMRGIRQILKKRSTYIDRAITNEALMQEANGRSKEGATEGTDREIKQSLGISVREQFHYLHRRTKDPQVVF